MHGRRDADGRHSQFKDFVRCLDCMVQVARERQVDAVVFTGDAYHYTRPDPLSQREFLRRVLALAESGISVLLLSGNHDLPPGYGEAAALDIVNLFKVEGIEFVRHPKVVTLRTKRGALHVACLPYLPRRALITVEEERGLNDEQVCSLMAARAAEMVKRLCQTVQRLGGDEPALLAGHIWVDGVAFVGSERILSPFAEPAVSPGVLRQQAFAYVALGHIHRHQIVGEMTPPIVYAGNMGRLSFDEEKDDKGFLVVELGRSPSGRWGVEDLQFVPTPTRPFVTVRLDLSSAADPTQFALNALAGDRRLDGAVVRLFVTLAEHQRGQLNLATLRGELEKRVDYLAAVSVQVATEHNGDRPLLLDPRDPDALNRVLQRPLDLLHQWLMERATTEPSIAQRREILLRRARALMDSPNAP